MSVLDVCLVRSKGTAGEPVLRFDVKVLDDYLDFVAGRCRPNTVLATAYDLRVFFSVVALAPEEVTSRDVLAFMTAQRAGRPSIARTGTAPLVALSVADGEGVSNRTLRRRLSSISGLYVYLVARGDIAKNPVPRGLPTRRERNRPHQGVPLVRSTRTVPRILTPDEVDKLTAALRTHRDRAMITAMVLGGLRRCEVIGLRLGDLRVGERRVFVADGKGSHQRLVPLSGRFFDHVAAYLDTERPFDLDTDRVFLVLKRPRRGQPLTASGLDQILTTARARAGLAHATCHELRHTCLTRLRKLRAVQTAGGPAPRLSASPTAIVWAHANQLRAVRATRPPGHVTAPTQRLRTLATSPQAQAGARRRWPERTPRPVRTATVPQATRRPM